jgi:hypothetical protein
MKEAFSKALIPLDKVILNLFQDLIRQLAVGLRCRTNPDSYRDGMTHSSVF